MNKNNIIFILFVATLLGSTWGAVVNRQKIDLERQLQDAREEQRKLSEKCGKEQARTQSRPVPIQGSPAETKKQQATAGSEPSAQGQKPGGNGTAGPDAGSAPGQVQNSGLRVEDLQLRLDEANAQLLGLEKIVEEKNAIMRQAAEDKDRLQINMDVLLNKIADQQREMQAIRVENRELVTQLAAIKEMGDPRDKQQPVKE